MEYRLLQALENIAHSDFSEGDIRVLYEYSVEVARKHICFINSIHGIQHNNSFFAQTLDDEAQTYVSKLFVPVKQTGEMLISHLWRKYQSSHLIGQFEAGLYLQAMIRRVVQHQRNDVMRYIQPQEWKIRRSIRSAITSNKVYTVSRHQGVQYVHRRGIQPSLRNSLTIEELQHYCDGSFSEVQTVYDMARLASAVLAASGNGARCFRLNHLFRVIIRHLAQRYEVETSINQSDSAHELGLLLRSAILSPASAYINGIINRIYCAKGKISGQAAEHYKSILGMYLEDLFTSGHADSLQDYVTLEAGFEQADAFMSEHEHKLYYLISLLKQRLLELAETFIGTGSGQARSRTAPAQRKAGSQ